MDADTAMSNIPSCVSLRNFNSLTDDDMSSDDDRPLLITVTRKQLTYVWNERQRTKYKARVLRKDGKYAKVHYINFNKRYDEWVNLVLISTEKDELGKKWKSKESHVEIPAKCGEVSKSKRIAKAEMRSEFSKNSLEEASGTLSEVEASDNVVTLMEAQDEEDEKKTEELKIGNEHGRSSNKSVSSRSTDSSGQEEKDIYYVIDDNGNYIGEMKYITPCFAVVL